METVNDKRRTREIKVVQRVLNVNERMAEQNRRRFAEKGVFVLNVMSSPGSGKTATLQKTLERIMPRSRPPSSSGTSAPPTMRTVYPSPARRSCR